MNKSYKILFIILILYFIFILFNYYIEPFKSTEEVYYKLILVDKNTNQEYNLVLLSELDNKYITRALYHGSIETNKTSDLYPKEEMDRLQKCLSSKNKKKCVPLNDILFAIKQEHIKNVNINPGYKTIIFNENFKPALYDEITHSITKTKNNQLFIIADHLAITDPKHNTGLAMKTPSLDDDDDTINGKYINLSNITNFKFKDPSKKKKPLPPDLFLLTLSKTQTNIQFTNTKL